MSRLCYAVFNYAFSCGYLIKYNFGNGDVIMGALQILAY